MLPLISVIVPAYNAEKMIPRTLGSIIAQDYPNIEILLVDDGSSDKTAETAEKILSGSERPYQLIKLPRNMGVSSARNKGMDTAVGKYVVFLDSDDFFEKSMFSDLCREAEHYSPPCDITMCGQKQLEEATGKVVILPLPIKQLDGKTKDQLVIMRLRNKYEQSLATMYKRDMLASFGLRFSDGCTAGEDGEFFIKALVSSTRIGFIKECPYVYVQHPDMGCRKKKTKEILIKRYEDDANAVIRYLKYITAISNDEAVRRLIKTMLLPQSCQKKLSICAMKAEYKKYNRYLKKKLFRALLWQSIGSIFIKPEIFLKTIFLLCMPSVYYRNYRNRYK